MARIYYTSLVSGIRGRINGNMFSTSKVTGTGIISGSNSKSHSKLTKADAGRFALIKKNVQVVTQQWANLADSRKLTWNSLAKVTPVKNRFGDNIFLSGFQMFIQYNQRLFAYGGSLLADAPVLIAIPDVGGITVFIDSGDSTFTVAVSAVLTTPWTLLVYAAAPRTPGRAIRTRNLKFVASLPADAITPDSISDAYIALFGDIPAGAAVDVYAYVFNSTNGQIGAVYYGSAPTTP